MLGGSIREMQGKIKVLRPLLHAGAASARHMPMKPWFYVPRPGARGVNFDSSFHGGCHAAGSAAALPP
ncbi:hypothetical protein GDI0626 [Gluconacetobacter diazotrophicus PA1 5]|uniref:Uncharacterized protein n=1 Tax=Gluconacetobacter diazotrophicus (strain ATCC 49037 / DSM 5601 / CCUG 37298 / CIP 103539 / LMG 7603 / PAl5) TaxID=272568 RepID=A9H8S2_GLUDA|nr:hypothetical protein GDI0626 [Gluconacetobacter diazotrophicus PA1 5]